MNFILTVLAGVFTTALACPYLDGRTALNSLSPHHPQLWNGPSPAATARRWMTESNKSHFDSSDYDSSDYASAAATLDWSSVKADVIKLMHTSDSRWPSDYGNYGPLFVRLAWHTSGSYRQSDGRGGVSGGRQRFEPERSWADNTNLDKARSLLQPIKLKHGIGLSYGDLFAFAGTVAVETMGGPILGFCAGRVDAEDGIESAALGPSAEQMKNFPCGENNAINGTCTKPLGANTVGLIYLNPEGPLGIPDPDRTPATIRDTFSRMAMNDTETVALIGGGHAFGKTHGACPSGPGPSPKEDPLHPWPGTCTGNPTVTGQKIPSARGIGANAFTSGFDGPWTTTPTEWNNEYFKNLVNYEWEKYQGPSGHWQWRVAHGAPTPKTDGPQGGTQHIMMMTSDVSLVHDSKYNATVQAWADDTTRPTGQELFDHSWKHAWYKLTTRDRGPRTRCLEATGSGFPIPPAQPWQHPLPVLLPNTTLANFTKVAEAIREVMIKYKNKHTHKHKHKHHHKEEDDLDVSASFIKLAYQCAATFRSTDFQGGCNGARIRFAPQSEWDANAGIDATLNLLEPIMSRRSDFGGALSWSDLIVLAGTVALEDAGLTSITFCGGRTDAPDDGSDLEASSVLVPTQFGPDPPGKLSYPAVPTQLMYLGRRLSLNNRELVALIGGLHTIGDMSAGVNDPTMIPPSTTGVIRPNASVWTRTPGTFSNGYFVSLIENDWACVSWPNQKAEDNHEYWNCNRFEPVGNDGKPATVLVNGKYTLAMLPTDMVLKSTPELAEIASEFISPDGESSLFQVEFAKVWAKVMNNDRFDGPTGSVCSCN